MATPLTSNPSDPELLLFNSLLETVVSGHSRKPEWTGWTEGQTKA